MFPMHWHSSRLSITEGHDEQSPTRSLVLPSAGFELASGKLRISEFTGGDDPSLCFHPSGGSS